MNYAWSETEVGGGLFPNEVTDNISCNESDIDSCLDTLYDTNISLNARKSVRVKSMSKTSPAKFVRYFCMLFWDDITIIWDENIVYLLLGKKPLLDQ